MNLTNKVAIVVGASRGIGRAIALKLAELDCKVVGVYEKNEKKAKELEKANKNITMFRADVGQEQNINEVVKKTVSKYGKIDILVNNAGIFISGTVYDYSLKNWNRMLAVNLTSKFLFSKYCIPYLEKSEDGVIISISSRFGLNEYTCPNCISYGVTNAGINNFTAGLAKELKSKNIRVNEVIPTVTNTDRFKNAFSKEEQDEIIGLGKLGTPEEVADMVISLITDKSKTGEIVIDKRVYIKSDA